MKQKLLLIIWLLILIRPAVFSGDGDAYVLIGASELNPSFKDRMGVYKVVEGKKLEKVIDGNKLPPYANAICVTRSIDIGGKKGQYLFITSKHDMSFAALPASHSAYAPYKGIGTEAGLKAAGLKGPQTGDVGAQLPTTSGKLTVMWDEQKKVLFYKTYVNADASWKGKVNHSFNYHKTHTTKQAKYGGGHIKIGPESFVDVSHKEANQSEWGITGDGDYFVPNSAWVHPGIPNPARGGFEIQSRLKVYLIDVKVGLKGFYKDEGQKGASQFGEDSRFEFKDEVFSPRLERYCFNQCGDPCSKPTPNPITADEFNRTPYELIVGPSGRRYKFSPYKGHLLSYQEPGDNPQGNWRSIDVSNISAYSWVVNVDCGSDIKGKLNHIGCATKSKTEDWLYLSASKDFAVGDQFDGKGGVLYFLNDGNVQKQDHEGPGKKLGARQGVAISGLNGEKVRHIGANGIGDLYVLTEKAEDKWEWDRPDPGAQWEIDYDATGRYDRIKGRMKKGLVQKIYKVPIMSAKSNVAKLIDKVAAAYSYKDGYNYRLTAGAPKGTPLKAAEVIPGSPELIPEVHALQTDLAVVVDAGFPVKGISQIDIVVNTAVQAGKFEKLKPLANGTPVYWVNEDLGENEKIEFQFENPAVLTKMKGVSRSKYNCDPQLVPGPPGPYGDGTDYENAAHINWANQAWYKTNNVEGNSNGKFGGWASNVVEECIDGKYNSIQYRWSVWLIGRSLKDPLPKPVCVFEVDGDDGNITGADWVSYLASKSFSDKEAEIEKGYKFRYRFKEAGVYEVRCQARAHVYDYRAAGISVDFFADPDKYIDEDGENDKNTIGQEAYICRGQGTFPDSRGKYVEYYAKAFFPISNIGDRNVVFKDAAKEKQTIGCVRVVVGEKEPNLHTWAACRIVPPKLHPSAKLPKGATEANVLKTDVDKANANDKGVNEDVSVSFQAQIWVKYWQNIDEEYLYEKDKTRKNFLEQYNLKDDFDKQKLSEMFSGVVPGTVRWEWTIEMPPQKGSKDSKKIITVSSTSDYGIDPEKIKDFGKVLSEKDAKGLLPYKLYRVPLTGNLSLKADSPCFPKVAPVPKDQYDVNLVSSISFPDKNASIAEGTLIAEFSGKRTEIGPILWDTPSEGREDSAPNNFPNDGYLECEFKVPGAVKGGKNFVYKNVSNCYLVRLRVIGDVRRYDLTDPKTHIKDKNGKIIGYKPLSDSTEVIAEDVYEVRVFDTTAPVVSMKIYYGDRKDGKENTNLENSKETGATTGDLFSNDIVVEVRDNNPYINVNNKNFKVLLSYVILTDEAKNVDPQQNIYEINGTPYKIVNEGTKLMVHKWSTPPDFDPAQFTIVPKIISKIRSGAGGPIDKPGPCHTECSEVEENPFVYKKDQWPINPENAGTIYLYAVARDAAGNTAWASNGDSPRITGMPEMPDGSHVNNPELYANRTGVDEANTSTPIRAKSDDAGTSYALKRINILDNDPPCIYLSIRDIYYPNAPNPDYFYSKFVVIDNKDNNKEVPKLEKGKTKANYSLLERVGNLPDRNLYAPNGNSLNFKYTPTGISEAKGIGQGYPEELPTKTQADDWPEALKDITTPDGKIVVAIGAERDQIGNGTLLMQYFGVPVQLGFDDKYYNSAYFNNPSYNKWIIDLFETNPDANKDGYAITNITKQVFPSMSPSPDAFEIVEDVRVQFRFRAEDNVDGVINLLPVDSTGSVIQPGDSNSPMQFYIRILNASTPSQNVEVGVKDGNLPKEPGKNKVVLFRKGIDPLTGEKDPNFYFVYKFDNPTYPRTARGELFYSVRDRAGNTRAIRIPIRIVPGRLKAHTLEKRKNF